MSALSDPMIRRLARSPAPPWLLAAVLAAVCAWLLARLVWLAVAGPALPSSTGVASDAVLHRAPVGSIAPWRLFGQPSEPRLSAAPATALALTLRGTFASPDPANGLAFIADAQGRERAYRTGETVLDDAVLDEVHADYVVLRRGGVRETLRLRRSDSASAPPDPPRPPAAADPSGGYLTGNLHFGAPDLATARAAQAPGLEAIAATANVLPVTENGQLIGVRLALPDPAVLERIGLHPDDVVTAVNGVAVSDPGQRQALEASLRGTGPLVLSVRRDGRDRLVTVRN